MECTAAKREINETFIEVRNFSYEQKKEDTINSFLDKILELQNHIAKKTDFLEDLCPRFERITWIEFNEIDEETLKVINDIISITRDILRSMTIEYAYLNNKYKRFASSVLKDFKAALDDLKEATNDLEDIFFELPKNERFQIANRKIQSL